MAPPPGTLRVGRYFTALIVLLGVLYALVAFPGNRHTPKLGIDLVGGVRVIFTAKAPQGKTPSSASMNEARQILEDRINGNGVSQSTVIVQGSDQIVVSIPGGTGTDVAKLGQAAVLNFRPLIAPAAQVTCGVQPTSTASPSGSGSATGTGSKAVSTPTASTTSSAGTNDFAHHPLQAKASTSAKASTGAKTTAKATSSPKPSATTTPSGTAKATGSASTPAGPTKCYADPIAQILKVDKTLQMPTTETAFNALTATRKQEIAAALANFDCAAGQSEKDIAKSYFIACDSGSGNGLTSGRAAYLLGSVIVPGRQISDASALAPGSTQGATEWSVQLTLKSGGSAAWGNWTSAHNSKGQTSGNYFTCGTSTGVACSLFVGFTLDGQIISAPITTSAINGQATSITGSFSQKSANDLATKLKYGALPLSFRADSNQRVSATLGTAQLKSALLAGGIGLILVVIYSLLYYRGLGLITIASLAVSGALTYAMLVILGTQIGFTLDLSGIAGFIVALGITADSFVVFFERIKDEVHEGRSVRVAVPRAWVRARRTVLSADTVSFLAAAILYFFASADVKGFAFTLGLSTILDLVVVFLFTHPIVSVLSRSARFGSARFSGLDAVRVGGIAPDREPTRGKRAGRSQSVEPSSGSTAVPTTRVSTTKAPVAVLDDDPPALDEVGSTGDDAGVDEDADAADSTESRPRRHTTPDAGTAAERAAARRARMRGKDDGKGGL